MKGRPLEEIRDELDSLVGADQVKDEFNGLIDTAIVQARRREAGLPVSEQTNHLVFTGAPGTGKTTVARLLGQAYHSLGLIPKDEIVEVDRSQLVGGYAGQTALKVREQFMKAKGGVLFVDEAYALKNGPQDAYGQEAVDTLMKLAEDHRDDTVVILAGYGKEMGKLMRANPGMMSRFPRSVDFPDYGGDEMSEIASRMLRRGEYRSDAESDELIRDYLSIRASGKHGNARDVRNLVEAIERAQHRRLAADDDPSPDGLSGIVADDVADAAEQLGWTHPWDAPEKPKQKRGTLVPTGGG